MAEQNRVRFTGGDNLTYSDGLAYYIHQTMMLNELSGGYGAYKMSNAGNAKSGPSFGPIQYDLGSNEDGRKLLERIAREAKDPSGNRFLSDKNIHEMREHLYKPFDEMSRNEKQIYQNLRPKLDAALTSPVGMELVNKDYTGNILPNKISKVNDIISKVSVPDNKKFLESNMQAQVFIADINNQYGTKVNTALEKFLSQTEHDKGVILPGGKVVKIHENLDMEDLKSFRMNTVYGLNYPKDARRRDDNIEKVTAPTREHNKQASLSVEELDFFRQFRNDKDGSFATKMLAENPQVMAGIEERVQEQSQRGMQQQQAAREMQEIEQQQVRDFGGRSFG